jgi:pimeloyl-ACP methyl ester carboxylesterase
VHESPHALVIGLPSAIRRAPGRFPALVVIPQCPRDRTWNEPGTMAVAMAALDRSRREFGGDPASASLTGLSIGGYGTWYLAAHHPTRFAVLGVVCGGIHPPAVLRDVMPGHGFDTTGDPSAWVAARVAHIPTWIFHGSDDGIVPAEEWADGARARGGGRRRALHGVPARGARRLNTRRRRRGVRALVDPQPAAGDDVRSGVRAAGADVHTQRPVEV